MSRNTVVQKSLLSSDRDLIERVLAGETAFFEVLIRRYNPLLYKTGRSYGFNHQDTEDLMQECHVSAFFALKQFLFKSSYKTWLTRIMIHKCLYKLNHGRSRHEKPDTDMLNSEAGSLPSLQRSDNAEARHIRKEFSSFLESALERLPAHYRTVFVLRAIEGFSVAETAELMNITEVNVKVRFSRARAMLQQLLEHYYSKADVYEFHLRYCDKIVTRVFEAIAGNGDQGQ